MAVHANTVRLTVISQVGLYGLLLVCAALLPRFLFEKNEGGISNYGLYARTIIPFSLAFLIGSGCLLYAARMLPKQTPDHRRLVLAMRCIAILLLCVLVSTYPYKVNGLFDGIHVAAAVLLFAAELAAGVWFVLRLAKNNLGRYLLLLQLIGVVLTTLSYVGLFHVLFVGQMITGIAFGILLVNTVSVASKIPDASAT